MSILKRIHPDMMPIIPAPGGRATPCSISYRKVGDRYIMSVSLSKQTAYLMGFDVEDPKSANYAEIGFDEPTGTLVLVNVSDPDLPTTDTVRWKAQLRQGTVVANIRAAWMPADYEVYHPAERCEFKIMDEEVSLGGGKGARSVKYIEISVPAWAAPKRTRAAVTVAQVPPARPSRLLDTMPHVRPGTSGVGA